MRIVQKSVLAAAVLGVAALAPAATLTWDPGHTPATPSGGAGAWNLSATPTNWSDATNDVAWTDGDDAVFGGTAGTVSIGDSLNPTSMTFNTSGYTLSVQGNDGWIVNGNIILNNADLTIQQNGGNGAGKTFTGGITGTGNLTLNNSGASDPVTLTGLVNNSGTITNQGAAQGGGMSLTGGIGANVTNIVQNAPIAQMTIKGANLQTGTVSVLAKVLDFVNTTSLYNGTASSWTAANIDVKSGATLAVGYSGSGTFLAADVDTLLDSSHLGASTATSGLESGAFLGFDFNQAGFGNSFTYASNIVNPNSGANVLGVQILGGGDQNILSLTGTASTYTGATILGTSANLKVSKLADGSAASSIGQSTNAAANLVLGAGSSLTYTGSGDSTDRLMTFGALSAFGATGRTINNSGTTGALTFTNTGAVVFGGTAVSNNSETFTLGGTNTGANTFAPILTDNGVTAQGKLSFTKSGVGTWALNGVNTYTGTTTVSGGTLLVGDATHTGASLAAGSAVTVTGSSSKGSATLGGYGTVGGTVSATGSDATHLGIIAPGASIGALGVGATTFGDNSELAIELTNDNIDRLNVTGNLDLSSTLDNLVFTATGTQTLSLYTLVTYTGSLNGTFDTVSGVPTGYTLDYSTAGQINLVAPAVPEPATLGLLGVGAIGLLARRRRRTA